MRLHCVRIHSDALRHLATGDEQDGGVMIFTDTPHAYAMLAEQVP
jgi:hypothetical protein